MSKLIETTEITLTPKRAQQLLDGRTVNRPMNERAVRNLTRAIENGTWVVTHQGIAVNHLDQLIDGQHRCQAVVNANKSVKVLFSKYPEGSQPHSAIDIGTKRTAAHAMAIQGHVEPTKARFYESLARALSVGLDGIGSRISEEDVFAVVDRFRPEFEWAANLTRKRLLAAHYAALAFAYPAAKTIVTEAAHKLVHNADLVHKSPLWLLSNRISAPVSTGSYSSTHESFLLTLRVLQAENENQTIRQLKYVEPSDGRTPEALAYWQAQRKRRGYPITLFEKPLEVVGQQHAADQPSDEGDRSQGRRGASEVGGQERLHDRHGQLVDVTLVAHVVGVVEHVEAAPAEGCPRYGLGQRGRHLEGAHACDLDASLHEARVDALPGGREVGVAGRHRRPRAGAAPRARRQHEEATAAGRPPGEAGVALLGQARHGAEAGV